MKFKNKLELVSFIKEQIGIELENDKNDRFNKKRNILYTQIPGLKKTMIMSFFYQWGIKVETHHNDYCWIYIKGVA